MTTVVLEVNEIPLKVLEKYISENPESNLSKLKYKITTIANDLPEDELYPSQTWASINTGLSYSKHQVKWFSDELNTEELYWQKLQKFGYKTSIVGSLHTSPASKFLKEDHNFVVFIPDFFSRDKITFPKDYEDFQKFNVDATNENRRVSSLGLLKQAFLSFLKNPNLKNWGLNNFLSIKQIIYIVISSIFKNKERLRLAQFVMTSSIFYQSVKNGSELSIMFTNHVASMMHRYLHAYIDTADCPYDQKWKNKYKDEVNFSILLLDEWVGKLIKLKHTQEINIILMSSMGQKINEKIKKEHLDKFSFDFILKDQKKFLNILLDNESPDFSVKGVMVPQYSYEFNDQKTAKLVHDKILKLGTDKNERFGHYTKNSIENSEIKGFYINSDLKDLTITLSVQLNSENVSIKGKSFTYQELGFEKFNSDNHHSGEHDKRGVLWSDQELSKKKEIDYLEVERLITNNVTKNYSNKSDSSSHKTSTVG